MQQRTIGKHGAHSGGITVGAIGLGCMGMSEFYGAGDEQESVRTIHRALELGVSFLDTADMYGPYKNEELIGKAIKGRRKDVVIASKFGIVRGADAMSRSINGKPAYVKSSCDASLKRLGVDVIDLYYQHRVDPSTPIEDTVGAMAELVTAGKVRFLGLSEASADVLTRACKVHPIAALQTEYSLWTRDPEDGGDAGILGTCRKLGVGFVAYSPLGRGFLSGAIRTIEDLGADDFRRHSPRFQGGNFAKNLELVHKIEQMARDKKCSAAQLALAWVLAQGDDIVPIPGTKHVKKLEDNVGALAVTLTKADLAAIDAIAPQGVAAGARYPEAAMKSISR